MRRREKANVPIREKYGERIRVERSGTCPPRFLSEEILEGVFSLETNSATNDFLDTGSVLVSTALFRVGMNCLGAEGCADSLENNFDGTEAEDFLNRTPFSMIGMKRPKDRFMDQLQALSGHINR